MQLLWTQQSLIVYPMRHQWVKGTLILVKVVGLYSNFECGWEGLLYCVSLCEYFGTTIWMILHQEQ